MPVALQPKDMLSMHLEFFTRLALKAAREGAVLILVGKLFVLPSFVVFLVPFDL